MFVKLPVFRFSTCFPTFSISSHEKFWWLLSVSLENMMPISFCQIQFNNANTFLPSVSYHFVLLMSLFKIKEWISFWGTISISGRALRLLSQECKNVSQDKNKIKEKIDWSQKLWQKERKNSKRIRDKNCWISQFLGKSCESQREITIGLNSEQSGSWIQFYKWVLAHSVVPYFTFYLYPDNFV